MGYIKAWEILPKDIIKQIQQYIDGEVIYIPKLEENRKSWGENTNTKSELANRNKMIYADYLSGISISRLAKKYYLVEKSIQRIIRQEKSQK
ncbi:CD3324 family protein [Eubacteriales bacterium SGI.150]